MAICAALNVLLGSQAAKFSGNNPANEAVNKIISRDRWTESSNHIEDSLELITSTLVAG